MATIAIVVMAFVNVLAVKIFIQNIPWWTFTPVGPWNVDTDFFTFVVQKTLVDVFAGVVDQLIPFRTGTMERAFRIVAKMATVTILIQTFINIHTFSIFFKITFVAKALEGPWKVSADLATISILFQTFVEVYTIPIFQ